jgi:hypothetical protein
MHDILTVRVLNRTSSHFCFYYDRRSQGMQCPVLGLVLFHLNCMMRRASRDMNSSASSLEPPEIAWPGWWNSSLFNTMSMSIVWQFQTIGLKWIVKDRQINSS